MDSVIIQLFSFSPLFYAFSYYVVHVKTVFIENTLISVAVATCAFGQVNNSFTLSGLQLLLHVIASLRLNSFSAGITKLHICIGKPVEDATDFLVWCISHPKLPIFNKVKMILPYRTPCKQTFNWNTAVYSSNYNISSD